MQTVVQYTRFGGPEVLEVAEYPDPTPGEGKVLIDVRAVGVNPIDWKLRQGIRPSDPIEKPRRLGNDVSGVITKLGEGVDGWPVGDEVVVRGAYGAYASELVASAGKLVRKPANVSFEDAAALGIPAGTAYQALASLGVGDGDVLLIHGASGAVGQAAIQFAESLMSERFAIGAAAMLVMASPTAMRPDAGASITASGVRSPMAIASPK